jgi:polygalacturonase
LGGFIGRGMEKKAIQENYCPRNLYMVRAKGVTVEGLYSLDAGIWNTHMYESANITVRDYKVLNDIIVPATDSVDIDSTSNVLIENCFLRGEDDNIVVKTTAFWDDSIKASPTDNVVARNNICYAGASALKFGTETRALTSQDIVFENNYIIRADTSIQITNYNRSYLKNFVFRNNYVEFSNSFTNKQRKDIFIAVDERDDGGSKLGAGVTIDNVLIDGLFVHMKAYQKNKIVGFDNLRRVKNVIISNYYVAGQKVTPETFRVETNEFAQFAVK